MRDERERGTRERDDGGKGVREGEGVREEGEE